MPPSGLWRQLHAHAQEHTFQPGFHHDLSTTLGESLAFFQFPLFLCCTWQVGYTTQLHSLALRAYSFQDLGFDNKDTIVTQVSSQFTTQISSHKSAMLFHLPCWVLLLMKYNLKKTTNVIWLMRAWSKMHTHSGWLNTRPSMLSWLLVVATDWTLGCFPSVQSRWSLERPLDFFSDYTQKNKCNSLLERGKCSE